MLVMTLVLTLDWQGGLAASASPDVWVGDDPTHQLVVSPLELTWSPDDGFGARSSVSATTPLSR